MSALERPRLRSHLACEADGQGGFVIWDQLRLAVRQLRLTSLEMRWLQLFDGRRTAQDIQGEVPRNIDGSTEPREAFQHLMRKLDEALFLDSPRFRSRLREQAGAPIRPPACTASYGDDPITLRRSLDRFFTAADGPGRPEPRRPDRVFPRCTRSAHRLRTRRMQLRLGLQGSF